MSPVINTQLRRMLTKFFGNFFLYFLKYILVLFRLKMFEKLTKYLQQIAKKLTKITACCLHYPLRYPAPFLGHWNTGYIFESTTIQARAIPPPSWGSAPPPSQVTIGSEQSPMGAPLSVSNGRPIFSSTTLVHRFAIQVHFFEEMLKKYAN